MATHAKPQTKPPPLTRTTAFPEQFRDAARHVGSPQDFFAEIEPQKDGRELVFHLWHKRAFTPENIGAAGNPVGKCRDVVYDTKKHRVTQTRWWQ
jgi:hypothetical protein